MTSSHPPNPDLEHEPDPVPDPEPGSVPTPDPCTANDPRFQAEFDRALDHMTDLIMQLPLPQVDDIIPGPDGPIRFSMQDQISELTNRAVYIEQAARKLEAARVTIMGKIPSTIEAANLDPAITNTAMLSVANEIAVAIRSSDQTISMDLNASSEITGRFPQLVQLIHDGGLSFAHAKLIANHGANLPDDMKDEYLERAVAIALETTPGRLRRRLPKLVAALSPESLEVARKHASEERRVWVKDTGDGMAMFGAILPAPIALAAFDRVTRMARQTVQPMVAPGSADAGDLPVKQSKTQVATVADERTLTQARADVMAELLLASTPARVDDRSGDPFGFGIQGRVQVTVPVTAFVPTEDSTSSRKVEGPDSAPTSTTTTKDDDDISRDHSRNQFGELAGYGLIDAEIARYFAADAKSWNRVFVDLAGTVISTDSYEPTAAIRRLVIARDGHCRFPACLAPPSRCEIDHTFDWAKGGKTASNNLALLCKRHHALKHPSVHETARWSVRQEPGGVLVWKSPEGKQYTDIPDPASDAEPLVQPMVPAERTEKRTSTVRFVEDTDATAWGQEPHGITRNPDDNRPF